MKKLKVNAVKWLSSRFGFKIVMIKIDNNNISIEGDMELLKYTDISGYCFKKEPFKRVTL